MGSNLLSLLRSGLGRAIVLLLATLLTACGGMDAPEAVHQVSARYAGKGDRKPHPGVARVHRMPVHGIDVSRYQGKIDWARVSGAGTRFAVIKATEGGDYLDPTFMTNWSGARRNGIPRAAYHFMYWCRPAAEQAAWFIRNVPADADAMPPVIDAEWNNHSSCKRRVSREDALAKLRIISDALQRRYGKLPIIYTDINFHRDVLAGEHLPNPFWLRSTAAEPHQRFASRRWALWQWTQTGTVPGIRGMVDRNVFYGSDREWKTFVATGCDPRDASRLSGIASCRGNSQMLALAQNIGKAPAYEPDPAPVMVASAPQPVQTAFVEPQPAYVPAGGPVPPPMPPMTMAPSMPVPAAPPVVQTAATMPAASEEGDLTAFLDQIMPPDRTGVGSYTDQ